MSCDVATVTDCVTRATLSGDRVAVTTTRVGDAADLQTNIARRRRARRQHVDHLSANPAYRATSVNGTPDATANLVSSLASGRGGLDDPVGDDHVDGDAGK